MMGATQWTFGVQVHAKIISPIGQSTAAMQTTLTMASGGGFPVAGSGLCELIRRRSKGSEQIVIIPPIPMPM